jgi:hypothetical protein
MGKVYKIISYIGTLLKLFGDLPFKKKKKKKKKKTVFWKYNLYT